MEELSHVDEEGQVTGDTLDMNAPSLRRGLRKALYAFGEEDKPLTLVKASRRVTFSHALQPEAYSKVFASYGIWKSAALHDRWRIDFSHPGLSNG